MQDTIDLLRTEFVGTGTTVTVQIVQFDDDAQSETFDLFDSNLDDVATTTLLATQGGQTTNFEAALDQAVNFFTGNASESNFMLFVSDGIPNTGGAFTDEVTELEALNVSRTAIGFNAADQTVLDQIDNTGGSQVFADADQLGDALAASPLFPVDLLDFSLTVNGTEVATEADLTPLGSGDFELNGTIVALLNALGADNEVVATATFDNNNNAMIDADDIVLVGTTHINGTDGSDVTFAGPV